MEKKTRQSGQVVLITLLVLTIATTVALSLISRTTTDTTISAQAEESSRAFSAAEAGIEEALKNGVSIASTALVGSSGVQYQVSVSSIGGNAAGVYELPKKTTKGTTETVWLISHLADGSLDEGNSLNKNYRAATIDVCWSKEADIPALAVTLLYKESTGVSDPYRTAKIAIDPDPVRSSSDQFDPNYDTPGCDGSNNEYRKTLTFNTLSPTLDWASDTLIALRLRPLYSDTKLSVDAGAIVLPQQGKSIESIGSTSTGTNRKIVVYQQYRAPATIFDAALYSQGALNHNY